MGEAAPDEPKSGSEPAAAAGGERPDWLVGAEDGVAAEFNRAEGAVPRSAPAIKLSRPAGEAGTESPGASAERVARQDAPDTATPYTRPAGGETMLDLGGGDSTPSAPYVPAAGSESLRLPTGGPRAAAEAAKAKPEKKAWVAAASSVPALRIERRRVERKPDGSPRMEESEEEVANEFPDDNSPPALVVVPGGRTSGVGMPTVTPTVSRAPVLEESWWLVAVDDVRTNRRTQGLIVAALLLMLVWTFWPRSSNEVSISKLRAHPDRFDGSQVSVRGRVGEVFSVGAGYAFYLHQGRDTLVVFTNSTHPESRQTVTVSGSITTGFLDGRPRQALFEGR